MDQRRDKLERVHVEKRRKIKDDVKSKLKMKKKKKEGWKKKKR